jgi:hypothetical protein
MISLLTRACAFIVTLTFGTGETLQRQIASYISVCGYRSLIDHSSSFIIELLSHWIVDIGAHVRVCVCEYVRLTFFIDV